MGSESRPAFYRRKDQTDLGYQRHSPGRITYIENRMPVREFIDMPPNIENDILYALCSKTNGARMADGVQPWPGGPALTDLLIPGPEQSC